MRRIIQMLFLFCGLQVSAPAQVFVFEDFSDHQMPPAGWSIDEFPENWIVTNAYSAGGINSPEARFNYINIPVPGQTISRLISPVIDLSGMDSVKLHFWYFYSPYSSPPPYIGVATRSAGGDWNTVWSLLPHGNGHATPIDLWLKNSDVGSEQFQLCMYLDGNLFNMVYWALDDITLSYPVNNDGYMKSLSQTPDYVTGSFPIDGLVVNTGNDDIHSAVINWKLDNGQPFSVTHSTSINGLNVPAMKAFSFSCTDSVNPPEGKSRLLVWIDEINGVPDEYHGNDTIAMTIQNVTTLVPRKPLYEEFTSSSCVYCPMFDDQFVPWCDSMGDRITVVKYQMDWPGEGDPYYTLEGEARRQFYGVNGVPSIWCDGGSDLSNINLDAVELAYRFDTQEKAMMQMNATHTLEGRVITMNATIEPYADFSRLKLYAAVVEEATYDNVGDNGQTEFRNVMMKMIPDAYGVRMNLINGQPYTYSASVDLSATHIERWDDLKLIVWVEDTIAKIVKQSCYSTQVEVPGTEARLINILLYDTGIENFDPDIFEYWISFHQGTVVPPVVTGVPMDTNATMILTPATAIPGTTTIDVYAQDNQTHKRYTVNFSIPGGIEDDPAKNTTIYPNPASGKIFVNGAEHACLSLFSATGKCLRVAEDFTGNTYSLAGIPRGVCFLKIERADGTVRYYKIVVK
jgi:hypothetical protein